MRALVAAAVLLAAGAWLLPAFWLALGVYVAVGALVALGLVLLTGVAGQTSFGQAAFAGIGAYATAVLTVRLGWSPWASLPASLALVAVAASVVGLVTVRLSGHFLPLGTIAWAIAASSLMGAVPALGGYNGLADVPGLGLGPRGLLGFAGLAVLGGLLLLRNLLDSRQGRAMRALAPGRAMAQSLGVNTAALSLRVFVLAALYAGAAGWLYAHVQGVVNPSPFGLGAGIEYLFMVLIGGASSLWGAVLGAGLVTVLRDQLNDWLPRLFGQPGNFEGMAFAVVVIAMMQFLPGGLLPALARRWPAWQRAVAARAPARTALPPGEVLCVEGLTKRFGGLVANEGVGLRVAAGEIVAVIGPNGAGKSTLFNQVSGLLRPDAGSVRVRGAEMAGRPAWRLARAGVGRTFQHVRLLPGRSVLENVAAGAYLGGRAGLLRAMLRLDRAEERRLLAEAAWQAGRLGLGEVLHRPAGDLALGQQRVVEIARALCLHPALLLLDEPAAGLRLPEKQALAGLLRSLRAEGMAVLLVEHDMGFVMELADCVVVMEFGRRIAQGTPAQVQADPAVRAAYLGAEA